MCDCAERHRREISKCPRLCCEMVIMAKAVRVTKVIRAIRIIKLIV